MKKNKNLEGLIFAIVASSGSHNINVKAVNRYDKMEESNESEIKNTLNVNKNVRTGTVLELTVSDGQFIPDLTGNPSGYETIRVTTTGSKELIAKDYDNLRTSGIPKIDLSNAYSESMPEGAFSSALHLIEFKFPLGLKSIDTASTVTKGVFYRCENLTGDIIIPDTVTNIGQYAFSSAVSEGTLKLSNSLAKIERNSFENSGISGDLIIPDSVVSIGMWAFQGCNNLNGSLKLSSSLQRIEYGAFQSCNFSGRLVIPDSVTSIDSSAFYGCSRFTGDIFIPDSIDGLQATSFQGMSGVDRIMLRVVKSDEARQNRLPVIGNLPNNSNTIIDAQYGVNLKQVGSRAMFMPELEKHRIDGEGSTFSLSLSEIHQESNVIVLKDDNPYKLPPKDSNNKYLFDEVGVYQITIISDLGNVSEILFDIEDERLNEAEEAVRKAEQSKDFDDIEHARDLVNKLPECSIKDQLSNRLNNIFPNMTVEKKTVTAGADVYIKSKNTLSLSLDTNLITFEEVSGVEDIEKQNVVTLTVESSLPYEVNSYLESEIQNTDKTVTVDKSILNIKANSEAIYKSFLNIGTAVQLLDNQIAGTVNSHGVDLKLNKDIITKADNYKTAIKFEVKQK